MLRFAGISRVLAPGPFPPIFLALTSGLRNKGCMNHTRILVWAKPARLWPALALGLLMLASEGQAQTRTRTELFFPDLPGLITLRCDFHLHTVFSDGLVWPTIRAEEAWRNGLDAIALSDHIEYLPHKAEIPTNYARPFELAKATADTLGLLTIRAAEITRGEPPGHWNALFLTNVAALSQTNYWDAVRNAIDQGGFLFWNHPGWKQPEGKSVWYDEQQQALTNGWLRGIEIVNGDDYDPIAHEWCVEKQLALVGNSDMHNPVGFDYGSTPATMRPLTLVFAKTRTVDAIREALFARRTAVVSANRVYGDAEFLEPLFQGGIEILNPEIRIRGKSSTLLQLRNKSPLDLELRLTAKLPELDVQTRLVLPAGKVSLLTVRGISENIDGELVVGLPCKVVNFLVAPNRGLTTTLRVPVKFEAGK